MTRIRRRKMTRLSFDALESRDCPATFGVPWPDAQHLTLSFVPDGTQVGTGRSDLFAHMDQQAPRAVWQETILRAFQTWATAANIDFGVVPDNGSPMGSAASVQHDARFGDIRIAATPTSSSVLAFSVPYDPLFAGGWSGDVVLNDRVGLQSPGTDLYSVMLHEAGHVLGIDGSSDPASAMYDHAGTVHAGLAPADVAQVVALYGPRTSADNHPHNTRSLAVSIDPPHGSSGPYLGAEPLIQLGQLNQVGDAIYYHVDELHDYSGGPVSIRLQTSGISLLAPRLTVMDENGQTLAAATSQSAQGGTVTLTVNQTPASHGEFFIKVEGALPDAFSIGRFGLAITFDGRTTVVPSQLDALLRLPLNGLANSDIQNILEDSGHAIVNDDHGLDGQANQAALLQPPAGDLSGRHFFTVGSLSAAGQVDFFQVVAPQIGSANTVVLFASVQAFVVNGTLPAVFVCDAGGNPLAAQVLANGNGIYTIQVANARAGGTFLVKVGNAASAPGNYQLSVNFGPTVAPLTTFARGVLSAATPTLVGTLFVAQDQIFQFLLNVGASASVPVGTAVHVSIRNSAGREVVSFSTTPGGSVSGPMPLLLTGVYSVVVTETAPLGARLAGLSFSLQGSTLSDPIGPIVVNPTNTSTGFSTNVGSMYYYFALPVPVLTNNAYLMYFPLKPTKPLATAASVVANFARP